MFQNFQKLLYGFGWIVLWLLVGVLITVLYFHTQTGKHNECLKLYPLTSQVLDCAEYETSAATLGSLEERLQKLAALYEQAGTAKRISIWVRDLTTLQWAAVNEKEDFAPASLFKLPLMITYFNIAEVNPTVLDTVLVYKKSDMLNSDSQLVKPKNTLVEGQSYSVSSLINQMVTQSDNDATALLLSHIDQNIFNNTLIDLGLRIPKDDTTIDFVTTKSYASVYRMLFNASYLNREYSQKALSILSKADYRGLAEPLPAGTTVAHKFGEREVDADSGVVFRQLHDCGIVYKANRPYSVCVMTEGKNFDDLLAIIQDISKTVYDNI